MTISSKPTACWQCAHLGDLPDSAGYCRLMDPPAALIPREVYSQRPSACPLICHQQTASRKGGAARR
jgi:hypothetical protein